MRIIPEVCHIVLGAALACVVASATAAPQQLKDEAAARKLYITKCSKCHKLYNPAKYSDARWEIWMEKMSRKSRLTPEEKKLLSAYLDQKRRSAKERGQRQGSTSQLRK